jgi:hypothetical protein
VGLGRSGGHVGQADFQGDDRLAEGAGLLRRRDEVVRDADRFNEHRDGADARVVQQVVGEGGAVEVGLITGGDEVAETDFLLLRKGGDEAGGGAALGDYGDGTRIGGGAKGAGPERHVV